MVSAPEKCGFNEAIYADNDIIISDSMLRTILPPQLKNMSAKYKVVYGCECFISSKIIHLLLLLWCGSYFKKLKDLSQNSQNGSSGEIADFIFDTYKTLCFRMSFVSMQ